MSYRRIDDALLSDVADRVNRAVSARSPFGPPIAEAYGVPLGTARRWVAIARQRGFLPPVEKQGPQYQPLRKRHGVGAYIERKCRCTSCCDAYRQYRRDERQKMAQAASRGDAAFEHGAHAYNNWGCRCDTCSAAHFAVQRSRTAAHQAETLERASRRGAEWTGPELELVARTDLTTKQVALALNRTYSAVRAMRQKVRKDPKTVFLAGTPRANRESHGPQPTTPKKP